MKAPTRLTLFTVLTWSVSVLAEQTSVVQLRDSKCELEYAD